MEDQNTWIMYCTVHWSLDKVTDYNMKRHTNIYRQYTQ